MSQPASRSDAPVRVSLALLVLIAFSGTLAMHIFVPALPRAAEALATDGPTIQLTVTIYILGLAIGQLVYGSLADAFGRRRAVLIGLSVFLAGSVGCFLAPSVELLLVARLVQALGGAGGLSLTRVIVADTNKGAAATRNIAVLNMILLIGPGVAPVVGAQIAELLGWRTTFIFLSLMGLTAIALSAVGLPETGNPTGTFSFGRMAADFVGLVRNRNYLQSAVGGALGSTACYAYFVSAPFILHSEMGLSIQAVGYSVGGTLGAAALGTMLTRSIVGKFSNKMISLTFSMIGVAAGLIFLAGAIGDFLNPVLVITLSCIVLFSAGALGPVSVGMTLSDAGPMVAAASGVYGCFQMTVGVICSFLAGLFIDHELGCGVILTAAYVICWLLFFLRYRRG